MEVITVKSYNPQRYVLVFLLCMVVFGCDSLVDVDPPGTRPPPELIFQDDLTAVSAVRGMYSEMSSKPYFNNVGISLLSSLSADDMRALPGLDASKDRTPFETTDIDPSNPLLKEYCWQPGYRYIYVANSILEGLAASTGVSVALKNQLRGEALFIRAFSDFYLTNLFGDIPLPTSPDFEKNLHIERTSSAKAYDAIVTDLREAQELFLQDKDSLFTKNDFPRNRASYWAATALLARVYLYLGRWMEAEQQATTVLDQTSLFTLSDSLNGVFLAESQEVIWHLLPVVKRTGTHEANLYLRQVNKKPVIHLTASFLETLEPGDQRAIHWIHTARVENTDTVYHFPYKYQQTEAQDQFHVELRLAELYLIRAEARAHLGNASGAIEDVDMIRRRAGLTSLKGQSFTDDILLQKIAQERRIEFFAEGGHRWLDLKRTRKASTLSLVDYKKWEDTDELYPVPQSEISSNPNLGPQNPGY
ncbi:RagB/SusD family nutrient uptake outer membrane protein [Dawidia soli]|uniref:RagB/SusD family nutrient uptake outer membrane protein n=1 Tax=Dawidia soli TaxID=2782352 RepID=A0AAP2D513_9BACT|nr:RagB/SusD family nutrient uptake outer membrane protein [Dawidia soli]MBT1685453.1 RagB/SusD family nutrient uptake outer membrane protein [Dawidia soli]